MTYSERFGKTLSQHCSPIELPRLLRPLCDTPSACLLLQLPCVLQPTRSCTGRPGPGNGSFLVPRRSPPGLSLTAKNPHRPDSCSILPHPIAPAPPSLPGLCPPLCKLLSLPRRDPGPRFDCQRQVKTPKCESPACLFRAVRNSLRDVRSLRLSPGHHDNRTRSPCPRPCSSPPPSCPSKYTGLPPAWLLSLPHFPQPTNPHTQIKAESHPVSSSSKNTGICHCLSPPLHVPHPSCRLLLPEQQQQLPAWTCCFHFCPLLATLLPEAKPFHWSPGWDRKPCVAF